MFEQLRVWNERLLQKNTFSNDGRSPEMQLLFLTFQDYGSHNEVMHRNDDAISLQFTIDASNLNGSLAPVFEKLEFAFLGIVGKSISNIVTGVRVFQWMSTYR